PENERPLAVEQQQGRISLPAFVKIERIKLRLHTLPARCVVTRRHQATERQPVVGRFLEVQRMRCRLIGQTVAQPRRCTLQATFQSPAESSTVQLRNAALPVMT